MSPTLAGKVARRQFKILSRLSEKAEQARQPTGAEGDKCQMI
jgi:hypothetical protein